MADIVRRPMGRLRRAALAFGLLSLAGVPPMPGFLAKVAVLATGWPVAGPWLTAIAALGGVFAALFYLRPVPALLGERDAGAPAATPLGVRLAITLGFAVSLLGAIAPSLAGWRSL